MGDPKKTKKKYQKPSHPWQKDRIEEEKAFLKEYGLRNKQEIWKMDSMLRNFKDQVKKLIAATTQQAEKEKSQLLRKLYNMNLIKRTARFDDILSLDLNDIINRRLQTLVYKKGFANTVKQARQFITHKHVKIDNKTINSPSYIVLKNEEDKISLEKDIKIGVKSEKKIKTKDVKKGKKGIVKKGK